MQGGDDDQHDGADLPPLPDDALPLDPTRLGDQPAAAPPARPTAIDPLLGNAAAKPPPAMSPTPIAPTPGAETWYRTDQDRYKSVHRRANPWYRRLGRAIIGLAFLAAAGIGLFFGARLVQDYLDREKLPDQGETLPEIRTTSFEVRSTTPAPVVDGTITLDTATKAFDFVGRGTGPQAGVQILSPDGASVFTRRGGEAWQIALPADQVAVDVRRAVAYLSDDDSADDILTSHVRRGYVDLVERVEVGEGDDAVRRYRLQIDTVGFDQSFPLQYREFQDRAIPGVQKARALPVTIAIDIDSVLVEVKDDSSNWSWQRLSYSDQPFTPLDPNDELLGNTIDITDGTLDDG